MSHLDTPIIKSSPLEAAEHPQGVTDPVTTRETELPAQTKTASPSTRSWHGFIGQTTEVRRLKAHIAGAKKHNLLVSPVLLLGGSGTGKSALARSMAAAIGNKFHRIVAKPEFDAKAYDKVLCALQPGDVLFFDEAHALNREVQERLMETIDNLPQGTRSAQAISFTPVLATDQPGVFLKALLRRLSIRVQLGDYTIDELIAICGGFAEQMMSNISPQGRRLLCEHARGEPRQVRHLVDGLRKIHDGTGSATKEDVQKYLDIEGYDRHRNTKTERLYLATLAKGKSMAVGKLATLVGVDPAYLNETIEPRMVKLGWINISGAGRVLLEPGKKIAAEYKQTENTEA